MADVAAVGAGVSVQGAAERAGDADQRFESGQARVDGRGDDVPQDGPAAGNEGLPSIWILLKAGPSKLHHHAEHALVADQHVRSAAEQPHRDVFLTAPPHQGGQLVDVSRLGEVFGRTPKLEPGVHRQRLIPPHDLLETRQQSHRRSFVCRPPPW